MQLPKEVLFILQTFAQSGFAAYVVGGCVRDALRQVPPQDWDICTAATPEEMRQIFAGETLIATGEAHGTMTLIRDKIAYELTTFRADGPYLDARHPSCVHFGVSLREDLARRDFTVNAMAYAPQCGLVDDYGGQADLNAKILRCVGNPHTRFAEDALRILRAARFAATLCFALEAETEQAALQGANSLTRVAPERVCAELAKLLCGENASAVLLKYMPLFRVIFAENFKETKFKTAAHAIQDAPQTLCVRLALLCDAVGTNCLASLRFDGKTAQTVRAMVQNLHTDFVPTAFAARSALSQFGAVTLVQILQAQTALARAEKRAEPAEFTQIVSEQVAANAPVTLAQLCVNGTDALALGVKGRAVGTALQAAMQRVLQDECNNTRDVLLPLLASFAALEKPCEK
ncbi:MAG: hypothetical protein RSE27_00280 [Ruthenibacterium sp.]